MLKLFLSALLLLFMPMPATAQLGFLDGIFKEVDDVGAFYMFGSTIGNDDILTDTNDGNDYGLRGLGFEVTLDLGDFYVQRQSKCSAKEEVQYDTTEIKVSTRSDGVTDRTVTLTPKKKPTLTPDSSESVPMGVEDPCKENWSLGAELGFGYTQSTGFRGRGIDLRGSLEELPAITLYLSSALGWIVDPYLGVRVGLAQLKNMRVYDDDSIITAAGSTYEVGIAPGLAFGRPDGSWSFFVEMAWMFRKFDTIDWTPKTGIVPAPLRTEFDFRTRTISLGAQYNFRKKGAE